MKIKELTSLVTQKAGMAVNQSMIAEILGVTRQTISNRIKTDSELTVSELMKIEERFHINLIGTSDNNSVLIDYYQDVFASCGDGNIVFSDDKTQVSVSKLFINNFLKCKKIYSFFGGNFEKVFRAYVV